MAEGAGECGGGGMLREGDDREGFEASKGEAEAALKRRDARRATLKKAHEDLKAVADDAFRGGRFLEAVKKYGEALRVVEDDDERKPAKCAMESIIRSKRRGFLNNIVCVCVCVTLTKNEVKEGQGKIAWYK